MPLGIDFWEDFGGFWRAKWSQVGTKIDKKSMPIAKYDFFEKSCSGCSLGSIIVILGVEVESKNRLKID